MPRTDLVLLHAPSVYDFRKRPSLLGPVSDVVPSTQVFEMYPIGFLTLLEYLQGRGHRVRIANVALRMLQSRRFDAERFIKKLNPRMFGLDLHWMVHAQGSLELAALAKKHHPHTPVIFGGLSASYFHEELIKYPQVDFVLRGDSTEEPLHLLLSTVRDGRDLAGIPNLTWKRGGETIVNDWAESPSDLDHVSFDYSAVMKSTMRHLDITGHLPFREWLDYPIVAALTCRGCVHRCVICGGSASAFRKTSNRNAPAFRSPEVLARDIASASNYMRAPIIILGDILQAGEDYGRQLLAELKAKKVKNPIAFEFFAPPPPDLLRAMGDAVPGFNIQMSPESHDEETRRRFGRNYGNASLEETIRVALESGCARFDVFFMIGIPGQTARSVRDTVVYCESLLDRFQPGFPGMVHPYISPLAPFLDPGSRAFEDPQQHGYRLIHRTLEEHRRAQLAPSWKYTLNYETTDMTRDDIVASTYQAALALNRLKARHGLAPRETSDRIEARIKAEMKVSDEIDRICREKDGDERDRAVDKLMRDFPSVGASTLCDEHEMKWPTKLLRFNPFRILLGTFTC